MPRGMSCQFCIFVGRTRCSTPHVHFVVAVVLPNKRSVRTSWGSWEFPIARSPTNLWTSSSRSFNQIETRMFWTQFASRWGTFTSLGQYLQYALWRAIRAWMFDTRSHTHWEDLRTS